MAPAAKNIYVDSLTVAQKAHATVTVDEESSVSWNPSWTHKLKVVSCILPIRSHSLHIYIHSKSNVSNILEMAN